MLNSLKTEGLQVNLTVGQNNLLIRYGLQPFFIAFFLFLLKIYEIMFFLHQLPCYDFLIEAHWKISFCKKNKIRIIFYSFFSDTSSEKLIG